MKNNLAPIILFVYNRLWHTQQTVSALLKNELSAKSKLYIYADGAKKDNDKQVEEVRQYIKTITGFKNITIVERNRNFGLADNIIEGVTNIVTKYGKIIVLEDDIVTSSGFLKYMNDALGIYEEEERVMHISGHFPNVKQTLPQYFFYNQTSCWGWGTWSKSWKNLNTNTQELYDEIVKANRTSEFNIENSYPFMSHLEANIKGKIKTWAIKWRASVFLKNGLCLHTSISFVRNIGFDGSGKHCKATSIYSIKNLNTAIILNPIPLVESQEARFAVAEFNRANISLGFFRKIKNIIISIIKSL